MTTELATTAFVSVPFHGDTILAIQQPDGVVVVSIKKVCESLGIDYSTQLAKLKQCEWAVMGMIPITDTNGRHRETSVIDLDSLPLWVVTIQPSKVAPGVREKLKAYQTEAAKVLAQYFLGPRSGLAPAEVDPVLSLLESAWMDRERQLTTERHVVVVKNALADTRVELP